MALKTIDGILLKDMIASGAALLEKDRQAVDQLNVFPVPDGDTGTNMSQTMNSAVREMNGRDLVMAGEILQAVARGALKGARGNSGVILSQILRGFAKASEGAENIDATLLRDMLLKGAENRLQGDDEAQGGHDTYGNPRDFRRSGRRVPPRLGLDRDDAVHHKERRFDTAQDHRPCCPR